MHRNEKAVTETIFPAFVHVLIDERMRILNSDNNILRISSQHQSMWKYISTDLHMKIFSWNLAAISLKSPTKHWMKYRKWFRLIFLSFHCPTKHWMLKSSFSCRQWTLYLMDCLQVLNHPYSQWTLYLMIFT